MHWKLFHEFLNGTRNIKTTSVVWFPSDLTIDPLKFVDLPENLQERDKYYLYSEMILQLQMARDHLIRQQSEKAVSVCLMFFSMVKGGVIEWRFEFQVMK